MFDLAPWKSENSGKSGVQDAKGPILPDFEAWEAWKTSRLQSDAGGAATGIVEFAQRNAKDAQSPAVRMGDKVLGMRIVPLERSWCQYLPSSRGSSREDHVQTLLQQRRPC